MIIDIESYQKYLKGFYIYMTAPMVTSMEK